MHVHPLERRWAWIAALLLAALIVLVSYTAVVMNIHPPSNVETIDSTQLHLTPEFAEDNLGVKLSREGTVVAHLVMARFSVHPQAITLPAGTPIVLRAASADVLHGLHVPGTNIGTQVVPGYVSEVHTTIDFDRVAKVGVANPDGSVTVPLYCNEYCGLGHQSMWGRVRVTRK
ncbi:MAG TPA: cytochrome C oxidase subunit II [Thermoanaerobaculia bacterium]